MRCILLLIQKRPLTRTNDELIEIAERIESASRLKFTDIYNNTNLSDQTDETTLFSGYDEIKMLSKKMGIVIKKIAELIRLFQTFRRI